MLLKVPVYRVDKVVAVLSALVNCVDAQKFLVILLEHLLAELDTAFIKFTEASQCLDLDLKGILISRHLLKLYLLLQHLVLLFIKSID